MKLLQVTMLFTFVVLVSYGQALDFQLEIPEDCKELGFCEHIPNYPNELAVKASAEITDKDMFENDMLDLSDEQHTNRRVGSVDENIELCDLVNKLSHPKAAVDANGKWHAVLNPDDNPIQGFRVEICSKEAKICAKTAVFGNDYQGRCEQKFVYRKMKVLVPSDGSYIDKSLQVPSCCMCVGRAV